MTSALEVRQSEPILLCDEDVPLVQAAKQGDLAAFEGLVRRHEVRMFRIAQNLLQNREDAQDAVQEVFLKVFQKLNQFREQSKFSTWLTRITINAALAKLRQNPVSKRSLEERGSDLGEALPVEIADWAPNPEILYSSRELHEILARNLRALKPGLRAVFLLRDVEGLSLEETAQSLRLSIPAVKSRSMRARLQLREQLNAYFRNTDRLPAVATPGNARPFSI
jgi:RNA polymerase sigma-70 factor, ECF subfamily